MARKFQMVQTYTFDKNGKENTERSSFMTLERAIEQANFWINKEESWIDTTVKHIEIINKETKEVVWTYTAPEAKTLGQIIGEKLNIKRQ